MWQCAVRVACAMGGMRGAMRSCEVGASGGGEGVRSHRRTLFLKLSFLLWTTPLVRRKLFLGEVSNNGTKITFQFLCLHSQISALIAQLIMVSYLDRD